MTAEFLIESGTQIPVVDEELYHRTRGAVVEAGYNFIVQIQPLSIADLLNGQGKPGRFGFVVPSETMRSFIAPAMEVAINPARFQIEDSKYLSTSQQKGKISEELVRLRQKVQADIQDFILGGMFDPSTLSQIDDAYMDREEKPLLLGYCVRTDVEVGGGLVACVGRLGSDPRRRILPWGRTSNNYDVYAAFGLVLPKLAV